VLLRTAFYRWLAKERVMETASAALLIQQSVGEFYFTITNPNKYEIKIDQIVFAFRTTAGTSTIDGARQTVDSIYVPAEGEVSLKVVAPTKVYDLLSWLTIAGQGANARAYAAQVWSNIQAGTITWTFTAEMKVSHGDEIENYSYPV
jgi:archaellin